MLQTLFFKVFRDFKGKFVGLVKAYSRNFNTHFHLFAAINMKMTAEECITAATLNAAHSLELSEKVGSLEVTKDANFIIADVSSYAGMFYHFGINHVSETWVKGVKI